MERFLPSRSGGRLPTVRYLSNLLLNRITFTEKQAFELFVPGVANGLGRDDDYDPEPQRSDEVLQSWEALHQLQENLVCDDIEDGLDAVLGAVGAAERAYSMLKSAVAIDPKSNDEHLEAIRQGVELFRTRAEL